MDIPLFITIGDETLSISWQKFDELAIAQGRVLPFSLGGSTTRWLFESEPILDQVIGQKVVAASLGSDEIDLGESEVEIWNRLLIELESGDTLEIYNALDENGIALHRNPVRGNLRKCT